MFVKLAGLLLAGLALTAHAIPPIQTWETENGARVLFVEAREIPIVDASVTFDAAASRDGKAPGLARLTSALLAEGADGLSADAIAERLAALGAELSTQSLRDMASVQLRSLRDPETLDAALDLVARVITRPDFPPDALERVRRQMLVGIQQLDQSPDEVAERAFYRLLYGEHPYGSPPEGTMASVTALSRDQVKGFWERHYVGRNALVAIVGDLDRAGAERVARALVGALPSGEPQPPLPAVEAPVSARTGLDHPSTQTHLLMGAPAITRLDPDYFPLYVGNHALGGSGLVSLLAEEVREKRGLSYSVYSALVPMRAEGPFFIGLQTRNEQAPEALEVALQTLGRFLDQGPSEEDLDAAKRNLTGGFPLRLDSNRKILGQLTAIGFYRLPLDYLETFTAKVNAVGREDVREAFRRHVTLDRLATVLVGKLTSPTAEPAGTGP